MSSDYLCSPDLHNGKKVNADFMVMPRTDGMNAARLARVVIADDKATEQHKRLATEALDLAIAADTNPPHRSFASCSEHLPYFIEAVMDEAGSKTIGVSIRKVREL